MTETTASGIVIDGFLGAGQIVHDLLIGLATIMLNAVGVDGSPEGMVGCMIIAWVILGVLR